ncbi:ATP-binding cassette domain-containing protein, partial [Streptomyces sp. NPDC000405]|uniref:ATP-binding cassette domain-containing protein n=1 Tax=Streptomyces sp. NPDC000405 TaxID=3161033 RepID=UPI00398C9D7D
MPSSVMPTPRRGDGHPAPAAISAVGLRKSYGDKTVLDGIDLRIPAGSVFALLGPNGAGKTTAVRILSTLSTADGGQAQVAGHDIATSPGGVRAAIGVTGHRDALRGPVRGAGVEGRHAGTEPAEAARRLVA